MIDLVLRFVVGYFTEYYSEHTMNVAQLNPRLFPARVLINHGLTKRCLLCVTPNTICSDSTEQATFHIIIITHLKINIRYF